MKIIDISWPIRPGMTEYKNKNSVVFQSKKSFDTDGVRETEISLNSHTGTHIDAPSHFVKEGKTIDQLPLDRFMGRCKLFDMTGCQTVISASDLEACDIENGDIVLFKTGNSSLDSNREFYPDFVYLDASAALYLCDKGIKAVGIDYLGIERSQPLHETHHTLLSRDIPIIEGLRFSHVAAGVYTFIGFPLSLHGIDASFARAVLLQDY